MHANLQGDVARPGRIGEPLEELRQHLLHYGDMLAQLVEPSERPLISDAATHLKQLVCRIAVVGQIKSGKSSFINAFVQQPNFLPTSVTPWTTAVTNLHFGQPAPGAHTAIFTFLHKTEWRELAETGGRIRELTERLVPGFEPMQLLRQADILRQRAQMRLGEEFETLLGQAHFFARLGPDTLQNYVCSGDYAGDAGPIPIGKYSDITRSADIYCGPGPFAFPSTVIDTPGINDPFLIRDEITRRSLGSADVYIVVLTARQPLSDSDVALLRIMRGLNKDRIIVLINRVDDLADVDRELPHVAAFVQQRLEAEFPGAHIPLVFGSAWWASQALAFDPESVTRILSRRSAYYLLRAQLLNQNELDPGLLGDPGRRDRMRQSLFAMSGLPALYQAIEGIMGAAHPVYSMRQITRYYVDMARACESAVRHDLEMLSMPPQTNGIYGAGLSMRDRARETEELARIAANIEASAAGIESQLSAIIREEGERLRGLLQSTINTHAARERDVLIDTLSRGRAPRVWTHEGVALRRALAGVFTQSFQIAASRLVAFHARVAPELHRLMAMLAPEARLADPHGEMLSIPPPPSVTSLSRVVALDLDTSWWNAFWTRQPSADASGARIEALIRAEFAPIAEELVYLADASFRDFSSRTIKWSFGACRNLLHALERRLEASQMQQDKGRFGSALEGSPMAQDQVAHVGALKQRLQHNETLRQQLERLTQHIDTVLQFEAPRAHE